MSRPRLLALVALLLVGCSRAAPDSAPAVDVEAKECKDLLSVVMAVSDAADAAKGSAEKLDYGAMASSADRASMSMTGLVLTSPGLKLRAVDHAKTYSEMAKAAREALAAASKGALEDEVSAQNELIRTLKARNEQGAQIKKLCGATSPAEIIPPKVPPPPPTK